MMGLLNSLTIPLGGTEDDSDAVDDARAQSTTGSGPGGDQAGLGQEDAVDTGREGLVDVDRRQEIIETHYPDVDSEGAKLIAGVLQLHLERDDGLSKVEAERRIQDRVGLSRKRAGEIFWTERASIQHSDSISECAESDVIAGVSICGGEDCDPPVCANAQEEIEERGGSVTPEELESILREEAEAYADEGATPERIEHWVPHHNCKAVVRTHVG